MTPIPPRTVPWTPDQPLRADATNDQIEDREEYLYLCSYHGPGPHLRTDGTACYILHRNQYVSIGWKPGYQLSVVQTAREFATACVAAELQKWADVNARYFDSVDVLAARRSL